MALARLERITRAVKAPYAKLLSYPRAAATIQRRHLEVTRRTRSRSCGAPKEDRSPHVCHASTVSKGPALSLGTGSDSTTGLICWTALSPDMAVAGIPVQPPSRHRCADGMCIGGAPWLCKPIAYSSTTSPSKLKQAAMIPCCFVQWVAPDYPHTARLTHPQLHLNPNGRCLLVRCVPRRLSIKCVVTLGWWPWLGLFISQRCLASGSKPLGSRSLACLTGCPIAYRGMIPHSFDWACTRTLW
jgi:hypothetical protein